MDEFYENAKNDIIKWDNWNNHCYTTWNINIETRNMIPADGRLKT
jgi:hypothetical protein